MEKSTSELLELQTKLEQELAERVWRFALNEVEVELARAGGVAFAAAAFQKRTNCSTRRAIVKVEAFVERIKHQRTNAINTVEAIIRKAQEDREKQNKG